MKIRTIAITSYIMANIIGCWILWAIAIAAIIDIDKWIKGRRQPETKIVAH